MPIPIPAPGTPPPAPVVPGPVATPVQYYVREHESWAVEQEQARHNQALYTVGEWVVLFLMWHLVDFQRGLVGRCQVCYTSAKVDARITAVYDQPTKQKCPDCLGTTFEGGYRARIVRPAIMGEVDEREQVAKRGTVHPSRATVDTTGDFRTRNGDYLVRADNSRWQLDVPQRTTLRSGFEHPAQASTGLSLSGITAKYEEPTQIVYQLPPTAPGDIAAVLTQPLTFPADFSAFEIKRGPLLPPAFLD